MPLSCHLLAVRLGLVSLLWFLTPNVRLQYEADLRQRLLSSESGHSYYRLYTSAFGQKRTFNVKGLRPARYRVRSSGGTHRSILRPPQARPHGCSDQRPLDDAWYRSEKLR